MTPESIIKECLSNYIQVILRFELALKQKYSISDNPYQSQKSFPKTGEVTSKNDSFAYRFHGAGCSFDHAELEVHYDYHIISDNYLTTVPWKFWRFVVTYSDLKGWAELSLEEVAHELELLGLSGAVQKLYPEYLVYQINFQQTNSITPCH